ncbi:hypothetical protein JTE90_014527 [Oedothorax gibbosus]|uniref:receptor protein-tyrosine kinase n=1 Tax=Oedothorax gibbosus TaxID=931172 RepID=A0AAV6UZB1_9ARAC|nr:hypothetical protein JTE90_014527 [Oedothorax gibbosus]
MVRKERKHKCRFVRPLEKMSLKGTYQHLLLVIVLIALGRGVHHADSSNRGSDLRLVVVANGIAILPCESSSEPAAEAQYTWTKDDEPVVIRGDGRIKITQGGHLIIKDTREEDSGVYFCETKGDNGAAEVNVTLIVLVSDSAPYFYNFTQPSNSIFREAGSLVTFTCPARGHPLPGITWLKNGMHLDTTDLDSTMEYMSWSITLKNLKSTDSGNYTCFIANEFGSINATFELRVEGGETERTTVATLNTTRPDLAVFHPLNTTVKYGSSATFQCRVRSEAPPNIQWLKKIEDSELQNFQNQQHEILTVQGENYRVLQSSEVIEKPDGSFLNKLTIPEVYESDSGKYICLGANSMGYSYRSAYLTVLSRPRALPLGWSRSVAVHPGHPSSLLVAIPVTLGIVVGVMVALVVLCYRKRLDTPTALPTTGYRKHSKGLDTLKDEENLDNGQYSGDENEDFKEEKAYLSRLQMRCDMFFWCHYVVMSVCSKRALLLNINVCYRYIQGII